MKVFIAQEDSQIGNKTSDIISVQSSFDKIKQDCDAMYSEGISKGDTSLWEDCNTEWYFGTRISQFSINGDLVCNVYEVDVK